MKLLRRPCFFLAISASACSGNIEQVHRHRHHHRHHAVAFLSSSRARCTSTSCITQPVASMPKPQWLIKPKQSRSSKTISYVSASSTSSTTSSPATSSDILTRRQLQWEFKGLTLWLELEEFDNDITNAVEHFSSLHSSPFIPKSHTTAIYGMEHLSLEEAKRRLRRVKEDVLVDFGGVWPKFDKPTGVTSDIAEVGKPGQVCSIAWSELTLATNDEHERALDSLYQLFYDDISDSDGDADADRSSMSSFGVPKRHRPWKPHNSIAYDNPETNALSLLDTVIYISQHPSLLGRERRVEAMSLWSTEGKMHEWVCIDRVRFW